MNQIKFLLRLTLSDLKAITGDNTIKKGFDTVVEKIGQARTDEDAFSIKKDYSLLIIKMDSAAVESKPKKSLMNKLFQKEEKELKKVNLEKAADPLLGFITGRLWIIV